MLVKQGSISPNFVRKFAGARTSFVENFAIRFHQCNYTIFVGFKIRQFCAPFAKHHLPQKGINFLQKNTDKKLGKKGARKNILFSVHVKNATI